MTTKTRQRSPEERLADLERRVRQALEEPVERHFAVCPEQVPA